MPIQYSPLARQTESQAIAQVVLTPTPRAPLENTPEFPQLRAQFGRSSTIQEGRKRAENSVKEEQSDCTEGVPAPVGALQGTGWPTLSQSNHPFLHQSEPSLLAIIQQRTQIMENLQAASPSEASRPQAFKTPSLKAPECCNGTRPFKVKSLIESCQLIFHNSPENFSKDRKNVLYATSFLIGRAAKSIEPYLPNITNEDPSYLHNSWNLL
ncbi:hypothetical protein O181_007086 [Austropuccinia psidii MF-1]|uniref:Uncharacterized protein n=1 Tax=Austropuccinia psidii MF-1 TaxID=1389203 RepID=A0A9Q3BK72_9BASI|nr:hypothetical protein [Austropuccinia psidii MF-1]